MEALELEAIDCILGVIWIWIQDFVHLLPARRYASAGLCDSDVSVRLSVRPSHAGIVPIEERKQDRELSTPSDSPITLVSSEI